MKSKISSIEDVNGEKASEFHGTPLQLLQLVTSLS